MSQQFEISTESGQVTRVYHGTDIGSAADIILAGGLDAVAVRRHGGTFWVTRNCEIASWYAAVNPAGGLPAVLKIELASGCIVDLITREPPLVFESPDTEAYEFLPEGFEVVNAAITSIEHVEFKIG